jgi:SAM-dependent methyltransferase
MADDTIFTGEQANQAYSTGMENHFWNRARNLIICDAILREWPDIEYALEIGCGTGILTRYLNQSGVPCFGCDPGTYPIGSEVTDSSYLFHGVFTDNLPIRLREKIQLLLLPDVLEHLEDPLAFIREQIRLFPNASRFLVTVPARQEVWSNYDEHYGHYRRYTTQTAQSLVTAVGGKIVNCKYFFHALYFVMRLMSFAHVHREVKLSAPSPWSRKLHLLAAQMFRWESRVIPDTVWGSSILMLFTLREDIHAR